MDFEKIIKYVLYAAVAVLGLMLVKQWHHDYPPTKPAAGASSPVASNAMPKPISGKESVTPASAASASTTAVPMMKSVAAQSVASSASLIHVKTDVLNLTINPVGGQIIQAQLPHYPISTQDKSPMPILHTQPGPFTVQAGLADASGKQLDQVQFHSTQTHYTLSPNQSTMTVTLQGQSKNGLRIIKRLTFKRGDYAVHVQLSAKNIGRSKWQGGFFHRIVRQNIQHGHAALQRHSYNGASISTHATPYKKLSFRHLANNNLNQTVTGGWLAMQQPYFVVSWVPTEKSINQFFSQVKGGDDHGKNGIFTLGFVSQEVNLAPSQQASSSATLYLGPELAPQLKQAAPSLLNTINYGILAPVSSAIFWAMKHIHAVIGNWGWTIVLVTLLIKLIFYPLSDRSYKSMARMREAQPRIKAMQGRFGDDKQALNQAMMKFYKEEKLNPVGGCLPMLIQIPVFFALYYVLIESVQLRQAPFIFWIHDLSVRDPYFIFPILMGGTMFLQQRLSPAPPDPTQAKVMMLMPIFFTAMFAFFPAGLVVYWLTNNLLSVTHQYLVIKTFDIKKDSYKRREKSKKKAR